LVWNKSLTHTHELEIDNRFLLIVVNMGILKKVKERTEEAAKKTASAAEKIGKASVELGKKGTKKVEETAKKTKK
jgi:hypothetical protein